MAGIFSEALCDVNVRITPAPDTLIVTDTRHPIFGAVPPTEDLATGVVTVPMSNIHAQQPRYLSFSVMPKTPGGAIGMPHIDVEYDLGSWINRKHFTLSNDEVTHEIEPNEAFIVATRCAMLRKLFTLLDGRA